MFHRCKIRPHERGLLFREGTPVAVLRPGVHWYGDPFGKQRLEVVSLRRAWLVHDARWSAIASRTRCGP